MSSLKPIEELPEGEVSFAGRSRFISVTIPA